MATESQSTVQEAQDAQFRHDVQDRQNAPGGLKAQAFAQASSLPVVRVETKGKVSPRPYSQACYSIPCSKGSAQPENLFGQFLNFFRPHPNVISVTNKCTYAGIVVVIWHEERETSTSTVSVSASANSTEVSLQLGREYVSPARNSCDQPVGTLKPYRRPGRLICNWRRLQEQRTVPTPHRLRFRLVETVQQWQSTL